MLPPPMRLAIPRRPAQAARMDTPDFDLDEVFLDAVEAVVLSTLERIGHDPEARFRFFRVTDYGSGCCWGTAVQEPALNLCNFFGVALIAGQ